MRRAIGLVVVTLAAAGLAGCMSSTLVLHVAPEGHGRGVITARAYEAGFQAFRNAMSASLPAGASIEPPRKIEDELPPPGPGTFESIFGTPVRLASTKLEKTVDGAVRTSVVEFDDITKLKLMFPPAVGTFMGSMSLSVGGTVEPPLITFAMKPHENGDRLLLVRMPDNRTDPELNLDTRPPSPEEKMFEAVLRRVMKGGAIRLFVELDPETPLLRTNAPASRGNRATILDLDLERLMNGLDEDKIRRAIMPGSMQELIWQLADMPGAVVPTEQEVFLEFEPPRAQQPPPPPARPAQAPPETEIYLAPMKTAGGAIEIGTPIDITNSPGYDNQPFFAPDGASVLFTSVRGPGNTQSDIYRYDIAGKQTTRVTNTPESEYSPTITPTLSGALSVIRVERDGQNTQRLWQFTADGRDPRVVLENVKPVGYHAWADDTTLALFILGGGQGQPATLQIADTKTGAARIVATDVGRSILRMPGTGASRSISFVQRERRGEMVHLTIKELNPATGAVTTLTPAVDGASEADLAWTPDGTLLMAKSGALYAWKRGQAAWKEVASAERLSLPGVTRLAVSPKGDSLALVASPRPR